jgi:hypothetical protein
MADYRTDRVAPAGTQAPVIETISRDLEKQLAELTDLVTAFESRLAPVMKEPEPSQIRVDNPSVLGSQSSLGSMLRQRVQEAESVSYRLSSIMRRLEI